MPEIVSLSERGYVRIKSSPKYSAALLNVDYRRDSLLLVFELLRDICHDCARICHSSENRNQTGCDRSETHTHSGGSSDPRSTTGCATADPKHLIVARLNLLVLLSKRVFLRLDGHQNLHRPVIEAIYHVLRLVIWSPNRSLRCAALRCLRYYVRTTLDVKLLLQQRADLLIARCMDLSYLPEKVNDRRSVNTCSSKFDTHYPVGLRSRLQAVQNQPPDELASQPGCSQPRANPSLAPNQTSPILNSSIARTSSRIHPRLRSRVSQYRSGARYPNEAGDNASSISPPGCLPTSPLVSALGERQLFLRLTYHLVRIAPNLFPASLVQAVAAPCLRASRFQSAGGVEPAPREPRSPRRAAFREPNLPGPTVPGRHVTVYDEGRTQPEEVNPVTNDLALRGCLLILAELVILAPEHVAHLEPSFAIHSNGLLNSGTRPFVVEHQLQPTDSVIVQALMSAFASCPSRNTIHPARIQEAVLLALLSLLNCADTAPLLPIARIAKFFAPFTSALASNSRPRTMFDSYPSYMGCAKTCLTMMFRSWSGLFYFLHDGLPCLQTLMYSLAVGNSEMRDQILDLLFGLFPSLPKPHPATRDIDPAILGLLEALSSCAPTTLPVVVLGAATNGAGSADSIGLRPGGPSVLPRRRAPPTAWDIQGGFVAAEGCRVFPRPGSGTVQLDLMDSYTALLLATLIQAGLYEALIRAVSDPNQATSVRAGLLLGLLAYRACVLLPPDHPSSRRLHQAALLRSTDGGTQLAVVWLERVHRVMHAHDIRRACPARLVLIPIHSPFLECLARQSRTCPIQSNSLDDVLPGSDGSSFSETWIDQMITQSGVVPATVTKSSFLAGRSSHTVSTESLKPPDQWDWELLASFGRLLCECRSMISWERKPRLRFLQRLMDFLTPSSWESKSPDRGVYVSGRSSSIPNTIPNSKAHVAVPVAGPVESDGAAKLAGLMSGGAGTKFKERGCSLPRGPRSLTALSAVFGSSDAPGTTSSGPQKADCGLVSLPYTWPHAPAAGILLAGLIPHLALYPLTSEPGQLLTRFLSVTRDALEDSLRRTITESADADASEPHRDDCLFSAVQLSDTCSGLLILALGRLTASEAGESRLEASGLCATFHRLLLSPRMPTESSLRAGRTANRSVAGHYCGGAGRDDRIGHIWLGQMLLSSLDFTRPGRLGHQLMSAAINGACKPVRLYVVQLIRLLFRIQLPLLSSWCVDLVVRLCLDTSSQVANHAVQLLEEICWDSVNVQALAGHLLPEPCRTSSPQNYPDPVTPFALRLLDPRNGPIGHRIFALVLGQSVRFQRLTRTCKLQRPHSDTFDNLESLGPASVSFDGQRNPKTTDTTASLLLRNPALGPVHWLLDVARQYYNLAYACEVDTRLWSLFTSPTNDKRAMLTHLVQLFQHSPLANTFTKWTELHGAHRPVRHSPVPQSVTTDGVADEDGEDGEDAGDRVSDTGMRCTNRELFVFDETNSLCYGTGGLYLPPSLTADSDYAWVSNTLINFWSAPLPRHPYGCLAEHAAGLDLLLERGDLAAIVHTLRTAQLCWTTTTNPMEPVAGNSPSESTSPVNRPAVSVMETKAALWALAHVGSATCGQAWIAKQPDLVHLYTRFATDSRSMGIRAVAWLCLNLLVSKSGGRCLTQPEGSLGSDLSPSAHKAELTEVTWFSTDPGLSSETPVSEASLDSRLPLQVDRWNDTSADQDLKATATAAFSVNSVPVLPAGTERAALFTSSTTVLTETQARPNNVASHTKPLVANGFGARKPLSRSNLSSWSHRTRRWLPRRWSPRRHKHGSPSPASVAVTTTASPRNSLESGLDAQDAYARHTSIESNHHPAGGLVTESRTALPGVGGGGPQAEQLSPTSSSPERGKLTMNALRSCATWTHRDQWIHRDAVLALSDAARTPLQLTDPCSRPEVPNHPVYRRAICLPADVRLLGRNRTLSMSNRGHVIADSTSTVARQLSFVRIAAQAQFALDKLDSASLDVASRTDTTTKTATVSSGGFREDEDKCQTVSDHVSMKPNLCEDSVPQLGLVHRSNASTDVSNGVDAPVVVVVLDEEEDCRYNECCLRTRPDLRAGPSSPNASVSPDAVRCLSRACHCQLQHVPNLTEPPKTGTYTRDQWCVQLLEVITGLLANVFSTSHELALGHLMQVARNAQLQSRSSICDPHKSAALPDRVVTTQRLFDACVYTDVAQLLENYTFPLEARAKIQAAFLGLDLFELLIDANEAVTELGRQLKQVLECSDLENPVTAPY